jgi:hypothetical protein
MIRSGVITILILFFAGKILSGQSNEDSISRPGDLSLRIKSINFIKNNEYFNPLIEGYTLLGFFFQPELVYSPSEKITLRAGTHLLKYSGTKKFSQIKPVFSVSLKLSDKSTLTLGSLSGSDKHRLFDPHFNKERLYDNYLEDGFQLTTINDHIFNDTWISWENFIFKGDSTREIFTYGESFRYKSSPISDLIRVEIPLQVQFKHFGGQISNYPEHVETFFNLATGLGLNFKPAQNGFSEIGIEYLQFLNNELNGESQSGITHGYASWLRFHYSYKVISFGAGYWKAHDYYAPNGNAIFGSVSDYQPGVVVHDRRIITNFLYINFLPENFLELFLGLETYYDIDLKRLDNAVTLHLNFDKLVKLATLNH